MPTRQQHRALEAILKSQRQLYNAALEERIEAYRKAAVTRTLFDQCKALTELRRDEPEAAVIKSCVFRRDVKGWMVGYSVALHTPPMREKARAVGVDLGITTFAALSDGGMIPSLRAARRAESRLRIAQRALARKRRGSKGRAKARSGLRRCHAETVYLRANHLHQASARLVRDYDVIAIEALNVKGLARSSLAKDVHDASWARFISFLRYKAEKAGAQLIEVDPRNTSQDCSGCGTRVPKKLGDRLHDCPSCGLSIDRDSNAARYILHRAGVGPGLHNVAGCGMRAGVNLNEPTRPRQEILESN